MPAFTGILWHIFARLVDIADFFLKRKKGPYEGFSQIFF